MRNAAVSAIVGLFAVLAATAAHAQWNKEPTHVFGVELGRDLSASSVARCVAPSRDNNFAASVVLCLDGIAVDAREITLRNLNLPGVDTATVQMDEGVVRSIRIDFHHNYYQPMRSALVERFGVATRTQMGTVTTLLNVSLRTETVRWDGGRNSIVLNERVGTIEDSVLIFSNNVASKMRVEKDVERRSSAAKDAAGRF
jgi:hypothetical protein